jgi:hypothetical protein
MMKMVAKIPEKISMMMKMEFPMAVIYVARTQAI